MEIKKYLPFVFIFLLYVIIGISIYSFAEVELTDDAKVFIGAGKQAIMDAPISGLLHAVDNSWELKPIANRMIYYFVASWSEIFGWGEDLILKIVALLLLWVILIGFCNYATEKYYDKNPIDSDMVAGIIFIGMLTLSNLFFFQAEWWAVMLSFMVMWLLLTEMPTLQGLAGILSVVIIFLKLSTLLLIPTIFIAFIIIKGFPSRDDLVAYGAGLAGGGCFALAWILYLPNMLPDMLLSVQLAHAAKGVDIPPFDGVNYLFHYLFVNVWNAPIIGIGIVAALCIVAIRISFMMNFRDMVSIDLDKIFLLAALWIFPLASILIQKEFFSYHYTIMIFPAVITVIEFLRYFWLLQDRLYLVIAIVVVIFAVWFVGNSLWSDSYSSQDAFWSRTASDNATFNEKYDLSGELLYLDIPSATYYLDAKSACRMIGSLPIERKLVTTREYSENLACIQGYQGSYVIAKHGSGMPALLPNYTKIEEGIAWDVYARN